MTTRLLTADFSTVAYRLTQPVICIIGAGYVGLVVAVAILHARL